MDRVLPNNPDAERAVLGAMMVDAEDQIVIPTVLEIIPDKVWFYNSNNGLIFDAIRRMYEQGTPADLLTVTRQLEEDGTLKRVGGVANLDEMIQIVPTVANVGYYAKQVAEAYLRRVIIRSSANMQTRAYDVTEDIEAVVEAAENVVFALRAERQQKGVVSAREIAKETVFHLRDISGSGLLGISTGFYKLDELTAGLHDSELIIVGGRPSMGKSVFVQNLIYHAAAHAQVPSLLFSLEMSTLHMGMRMLAAGAGVDFQMLRTMQLNDNAMSKITLAQGRLAELPIYIDDTPALSVVQLRSKVHQMIATRNVGLVVVDYLQLMRGDRRSENREQEVASISRGLKGIASEFNIPVVACAQLNRALEQRQDKRPQLADLRNSGEIEQDADLVLFLYREKHYDDSVPVDIAEVIIAKQRNGPTGTVELLFDGARLRFKGGVKSGGSR